MGYLLLRLKGKKLSIVDIQLFHQELRDGSGVRNYFQEISWKGFFLDFIILHLYECVRFNNLTKDHITMIFN